MIDFNYTILIQFFNLLVLLIILNFVLFKPVLKALNKRESTIKSLATGAQTAAEDVKDLEKMYEDGSKERRRPIVEEGQTAVSEAGAVSARMIEEARGELSRELSKIRAGVETESKKVLETLRGEVAKLSAEAAEKILRRSIG
jgi:F-type H+-transporting ATPase subunit b